MTVYLGSDLRAELWWIRAARSSPLASTLRKYLDAMRCCRYRSAFCCGVCADDEVRRVTGGHAKPSERVLVGARASQNQQIVKSILTLCGRGAEPQIFAAKVESSSACRGPFGQLSSCPQPLRTPTSFRRDMSKVAVKLQFRAVHQGRARSLATNHRDKAINIIQKTLPGKILSLNAKIAEVDSNKEHLFSKSRYYEPSAIGTDVTVYPASSSSSDWTFRQVRSARRRLLR